MENRERSKLEGTIVTCPLHGSQFDLSDGRVVHLLKGSGIVAAVGRVIKSPRQLILYGVKVKDAKVTIEI